MVTQKKRSVKAKPRPALKKTAAAARRGRPPGSTSLTKAIEDKIVSYLSTGGTYDGAADAAGINPRTLREWRERGESRHATRPCTPKLRRFAKRVRQARGEVRVVAEHRVWENNPRAWLARTARATPDDEGWADAPVRAGQPAALAPEIGALSDEELNEALARMLEVVDEHLEGFRPTRRRGTRKEES